MQKLIVTEEYDVAADPLLLCIFQTQSYHTHLMDLPARQTQQADLQKLE